MTLDRLRRIAQRHARQRDARRVAAMEAWCERWWADLQERLWAAAMCSVPQRFIVNDPPGTVRAVRRFSDVPPHVPWLYVR